MMNIKHFLAAILALPCFMGTGLHAQAPDEKLIPPTMVRTLGAAPAIEWQRDSLVLILGLHLDTYFAHSTGLPGTQRRLDYAYDAARNGEFAIDLAMIDLQANWDDRVRMHLAPAFGSYMAANYAPEPTWARNLFEMNAGVRIAKRLWLDAGVLGSPFGLEGAISHANFVATNSLTAENSPYYLSGARLGWSSASNRLRINAYATNGWQRIVNRLGTKAAIAQVQADISPKLMLNWAGFAGDERTDRNNATTRLFSDLYLLYKQPLSRGNLNVLLLWDAGMQQDSSAFIPWHGGNVVVQYNHGLHWGLTARAEYYQDPDGIIVSSLNPVAGFRSTGASLGIDYRPYANATLRLEARRQQSPDAIFPDGNGLGSGTWRITTALNIKL